MNERDGVLVLSPEAGAWEELADAVVPLSPLRHHAAPPTPCTRPSAWRATLVGPCRPAGGERSTARTPADWLADNLAAAG